MKIMPTSPTRLNGITFILLVGMSAHCLGASDEQSTATSESTSGDAPTTTSILKYTPPKRGAPATRIGGGTRSSSHALLTLTALAPNHTGYTAREKPTLYWYLSMPINIPVEITLTIEEAVEPLLEMTLDEPIDKGFHALNLTDHDISLKPGVAYQWFVAVVMDPVQRSKDILAGGLIERVDLSQTVQEKLDQTGPLERPLIYAESGLWYDAVEAITRLIDKDSDDQQLLEQRASLLDQVGLVEAAAYDRGLN